MRLVGSIEEIHLLAPVDAHISFFNSPYIGHELGAAIDIYPKQGQWHGEVTSPVSGRISHIKKITMGRSKIFPTDDFDYAIGIFPNADDENIVRVMHCKPEVSIGDTIDEGDNLGITIRSRYFNYWTGPHYHVEVLKKEDFNRSSKSLSIDAKLGTVTAANFPRKEIHNRYHLEILQATKDNVIVNSEPIDRAKLPYYSGLGAYTKDGVCGILDGGISHYTHGGIIGIDNLQEGAKIYFQGVEVGEVDITNQNLHHFQRTNVLEYIFNGEKIRGFSAFLYPISAYSQHRIPLVLVPMRYGQFDELQEGDACELQVSSNSNTIKAV